MIRTVLRFGASLACALMLAGAAAAADKPTIDTGDPAWLLVATGALGTILVGVFATKAINDVNKGQAVGLPDGNGGQILTQLYGVVAVTIFCGVATWIILRIVDAMVGLRATRDEEVEGLDTALHGDRVR